MDCCSQFDLLVELFQDGEKATSPTGQGPGTGGRTRLSVKPDKSRDKGNKEHKKTVGCQVQFAFVMVLSGFCELNTLYGVACNKRTLF